MVKDGHGWQRMGNIRNGTGKRQGKRIGAGNGSVYDKPWTPTASQYKAGFLDIRDGLT